MELRVEIFRIQEGIMKLEFLTKPNYLFEAVTLIVQTMQLDDDFDLENMTVDMFKNLNEHTYKK